ncbi:unnamed protein product, partial [Mesorhabditis spiculigera]
MTQFVRTLVGLLLAVLVVVQIVNAAPEPSMRGMGNRYITRILDQMPAYSPGHSVYRRFDFTRPIQEVYPVKKRNNAEVVNHILKNFGTLDRLGDVGK